MIARRVYTGEASSGVFVKAGAHEAIVSEGEWTAANRRKVPARLSRGESDGALLAGILWCDSCGHRLAADWTTTRGKRVRFYRCIAPECEARPSIAHSIIEPFLERIVLKIIGSGTLSIEETSGDTERLENAVENARADLEAFNDAFDRHSDPAEFRRGAERRKAALVAAENELAASVSASSTDELLAGVTGPDLYSRASVAIRRRIITELLPPIFVKRGRAPVSERVRFGRGPGS